MTIALADVDAALARSLPPELIEALLPFQREGVAFALRHAGRALIADEMGLGKTVQVKDARAERVRLGEDLRGARRQRRAGEEQRAHLGARRSD